MSGALMAASVVSGFGAVNFVASQYSTANSVDTPALSALGVAAGDLALVSTLNNAPTFVPAGRAWTLYGQDGAFKHYFLIILASEVGSAVRISSNSALMIYRGAAVSARTSSVFFFSGSGSGSGVVKSPKHAGFVAVGYSQDPGPSSVSRITSVGPGFEFRGDRTVVLPERLSTSSFDRLAPPAPPYIDSTPFAATCPSSNCIVAVVELLSV